MWSNRPEFMLEIGFSPALGTIAGEMDRDLEIEAPMANPVAGRGCPSFPGTVFRGTWGDGFRAGVARGPVPGLTRGRGPYGVLPSLVLWSGAISAGDGREAVWRSASCESCIPSPSGLTAVLCAPQLGLPATGARPDGSISDRLAAQLWSWGEAPVRADAGGIGAELHEESESSVSSLPYVVATAGHAGTVRCALLLGELGNPEEIDVSGSSWWRIGLGGEHPVAIARGALCVRAWVCRR